MPRSSTIVALASVVAFGCGSSSSGGTGGSSSAGTSVTGTIGGASFTPASVVAVLHKPNPDEPIYVLELIFLSTQELTCAGLQTGNSYYFASAQYLDINVPGTATAPPSGPYSVLASTESDGQALNGIYAQENVFSASGMSESYGYPKTATVTVLSVSSTSASGSFDLTIPYMDGSSETAPVAGTDHLSGSFTASICDLPDAG